MSERVVNPPKAQVIVCRWPHRSPMNPQELRMLSERVGKYFVPSYDVEAELEAAEAKWNAFQAYQQQKGAA